MRGGVARAAGAWRAESGGPSAPVVAVDRRLGERRVGAHPRRLPHHERRLAPVAAVALVVVARVKSNSIPT